MSDSFSYCFIINCAAKATAFFKDNEQKLASIFKNSTLIYITEADNIEEIARQKSDSFSHIVACGGDGTVNRVVRGIINSQAILGVLPLGSGNDFAKQVNLSTDFWENLEALKEGNTCRIDVIESSAGLFINTFGIGLDGLTNYYASQSFFKSTALRYFIGGVKALMHAKPFSIQISIDGKKVNHPKKVWMITVANGKTEGGRYNISPTSLPGDGVVELVMVKAFSRAVLFWEFIKLSLGQPFNSNLVLTKSVDKRCEIKLSESVKVHADGEQVVHKKKQFSYIIKKHAIRVIRR